MSAIPCYSAIFGTHTSIDSNSAVSDSKQNFLDNFPRYSRTLCSRHLLRTLERFPRTAPLGVTWHIVIPIEENDHLTASEAATIAASASTHYSLLATVGYKLKRKY